MGYISFSLVGWCGLSKNTDVSSFQLPHHAAPTVRILFYLLNLIFAHIDVLVFCWCIGVFCLKTSVYPHFNQYTNCYTELHRQCRFWCVSINMSAFSGVLPYVVWKHRCFLIPINTATTTASHAVGVPPVSEHTMKIWKMSIVQSREAFCSRLFIHVNIPWTSGHWVLSEA